MATSSQRSSAQLEAAELYYGARHCRTWTCVDNAADALDGKYLPVNYIEPENFTEVLGYIHLEGTAAAADPAPAGRTLLAKASFSSGDSAAVVAAAIDTALSALTASVFSSVSGSAITIENRVPGLITDETDLDSTGFTESEDVVGFGSFLGQTSGGISISSETSLADITSDQTGAIVLKQILQGTAATLEAPLLEMTSDKWKQVLRGSGDFVTPSGGTDVVGFGESKLFSDQAASGGMLILHPIRLARTDRSADVVFWRANGVLNDVNYSGSDAQIGNTTWTAYLDSAYNTKINLFAYGDWTQDGLRA